MSSVACDVPERPVGEHLNPREHVAQNGLGLVEMAVGEERIAQLLKRHEPLEVVGVAQGLRVTRATTRARYRPHPKAAAEAWRRGLGARDPS